MLSTLYDQKLFTKLYFHILIIRKVDSQGEIEQRFQKEHGRPFGDGSGTCRVRHKNIFSMLRKNTVKQTKPTYNCAHLTLTKESQIVEFGEKEEND